MDCCSSDPDMHEIAARYFITILLASVLPAPLSPDTKTHWFMLSLRISKYVLCATAHECGRLRSMTGPSSR